MEALDHTVEFSGRQGGRLFLLGSGFLTLRVIWAAMMAVAFFSPLNLAASIGPSWVLCLMGVVTLFYLAGADLLNLARLGAFASLAEDDARPVLPMETEMPPELDQPPDLVPMLGLA
jgi:hypothetical protein